MEDDSLWQLRGRQTERQKELGKPNEEMGTVESGDSYLWIHSHMT